MTGGVNILLSALADVTDVRVLSSPQVIVLDNEQAELQVGNEVPYLTQSSQSTLTTGSPIVTNVDYRETGVIYGSSRGSIMAGSSPSIFRRKSPTSPTAPPPPG